jgi:hypothetical protein
MAPVRHLSPSFRRNGIRSGSSLAGRHHNNRSPLSVLAKSNLFNARVKPSTAKNHLEHHRYLAIRRRRLQYSPGECVLLKPNHVCGLLESKATGRDARRLKRFYRAANCLMQSIKSVDADLFNLSVPVSPMHARAVDTINIRSGQPGPR